MTDREKIRAEIERLKDEGGIGINEYDMGYENGKGELCNHLLSFIESLPEEQGYPTSTEMIAKWENNELPMLREKDFRGDAERMAYNAFMDGLAEGLKYRR